MVAGRIFESATSDGYTPMRKKWIDCKDYQVPHYGLKTVIYQVGANATEDPNIYYKCWTRYWVSFRDLKYTTTTEGKIYGEQPGILADTQEFNGQIMNVEPIVNNTPITPAP
jgi:hypothetical protein